MRLVMARRGRELLPCARRGLACSHLPVSLLCCDVTGPGRRSWTCPGRSWTPTETWGCSRYESPLLSSTAAPETLAQHHRPASPAAARHPPTSTPHPGQCGLSNSICPPRRAHLHTPFVCTARHFACNWVSNSDNTWDFGDLVAGKLYQ